MKRYVVGLVLVLAFVLSIFVVNSYAAEKFGYVDLSKLFDNYQKTKDYDKVLTEKEKSYEADRDKRVNEIKQMQDKLSLLSDKEKAAKQGEMDAKIKTLQDYDQQKQTDLRKDRDDKIKEILQDIDKSVRTYAEKEGYTMVFNERVLVYETKSLDITDKVSEILTKGSK